MFLFLGGQGPGCFPPRMPHPPQVVPTIFLMHSIFCIKKGHSTSPHRPYAISPFVILNATIIAHIKVYLCLLFSHSTLSIVPAALSTLYSAYFSPVNSFFASCSSPSMCSYILTLILSPTLVTQAVVLSV